MVSVLQSRISIAESAILQQMDNNHKFNNRFAYVLCTGGREKQPTSQSPNFQSSAPDSLEAQVTAEEQDMQQHSLQQKQ